MSAPNPANNVSGVTPAASACTDQARVSSTSVSPTSKTATRMCGMGGTPPSLDSGRLADLLATSPAAGQADLFRDVM